VGEPLTLDDTILPFCPVSDHSQPDASSCTVDHELRCSAHAHRRATLFDTTFVLSAFHWRISSDRLPLTTR